MHQASFGSLMYDVDVACSRLFSLLAQKNGYRNVFWPNCCRAPNLWRLFPVPCRFLPCRPSTNCPIRSSCKSSRTCRTERFVVWPAPVANGGWSPTIRDSGKPSRCDPSGRDCTWPVWRPCWRSSGRYNRFHSLAHVHCSHLSALIGRSGADLLQHSFRSISAVHRATHRAHYAHRPPGISGQMS